MIEYQKIFHQTSQDSTHYSDIVLGADIGGTQTTITLGGLYKHKVTQLLNFQFKSQDLDSIIPAIQETLTYAKKEYNLEITDACLAAAGIISQDKSHADLTNLSWNISTDEIQRQTHLQNILIINDFQAIGYGINLINHTNPYEVLYITPEYLQPLQKGPKAIIGAGTGLGKTILTYSNTNKIYRPYPSEGGHADCPIYTTDEQELSEYIIQKKHNKQPLTYEDILSGKGITSIYSYLKDKNNTPSSEFVKEIETTDDKAAKISQYRYKDTTCQQTLTLFSKIYARCAKNLALDILPTGGIYIAGGIANKNQDILFNEVFLEEFYNAYQRTNLLKTIPIFLLTDTQIGLRGACFAAVHHLK
jgi:glucokinase